MLTFIFMIHFFVVLCYRSRACFIISCSGIVKTKNKKKIVLLKEKDTVEIVHFDIFENKKLCLFLYPAFV